MVVAGQANISGIIRIFVIVSRCRIYSVFIYRYSRRRTSDTVSIVSNGQKKDSHISLEPHYLQEIPKLFENEYSTYNTYA